MKTNKELISEGVQGIEEKLKSVDVLELEFTYSLPIARAVKVLEGIKEEVDRLSMIDGNIFYKDLENGNILFSKKLNYLNYCK